MPDRRNQLRIESLRSNYNLSDYEVKMLEFYGGSCFLNRYKERTCRICGKFLPINSIICSTGKCYKEQFFVEVEKRGWNTKLVEKALEAAAQTEVYYQILLDSVLNSEVLKKSYNPELGIYALH